MPHYQLPLFAPTVSAASAASAASGDLAFPGVSQPVTPGVSLELKPYIRPFERILARAELAGLLPEARIVDPFDQPATSGFTIPSSASSASAEFLRQRLAYWQRVNNGIALPTSQVLYEASEHLPIDAGSAPLRDIYLPKGRRLRYGPHDLHEYRGKFFPQLCDL